MPASYEVLHETWQRLFQCRGAAGQSRLDKITFAAGRHSRSASNVIPAKAGSKGSWPMPTYRPQEWMDSRLRGNDGLVGSRALRRDCPGGAARTLQNPQRQFTGGQAPMGTGFPINSSCVYPLSASCTKSALVQRQLSRCCPDPFLPRSGSDTLRRPAILP